MINTVQTSTQVASRTRPAYRRTLYDGSVRALVIGLLCACGRLNFDPVGDATNADVYSTAFAYWKFDEGMGVTGLDSTGHGHTIDLVNGPTWTEGESGSAVHSGGTGEFLDTGPLDLSTTSAITISAWVSRTYDATSMHTLFELSPNYNSSDAGFGIFPDDTTCNARGVAEIPGSHSAAGTASARLATPNRRLATGIFDKTRAAGDETALYIDGVVQSADTPPPRMADNTDSFEMEPLFIFARGGIQEFGAGTVDEVALFARALTPAEIATL